jgi:branched-chain amino acid transport system permease protein
MPWSRRLRRLHPTDAIMGLVGLAVVSAVLYGSWVTLTSGKYGGSDWFSFAVDGLTQGSIYALIALGYTLVYGILRMINFAHGEIFTAGAMTTFYFAIWMDGKGWLSAERLMSAAGLRVLGVIVLLITISALVSTVVAVLLERIAYRPLRGAPRLIPLITAIGASFFLQYTLRGLYGSGIRAYPDVKMLKQQIVFGAGYSIALRQLVVMGAALALMLALVAFVQGTRTGMAMRAVAEDKQAAALMGIDVDRTIAMTFAVGGAMAGAAGVLYALMFRQTQFFMGFIPGLKAFTAAVLGGIGNIPGAMLGGLFLGLAESIGPFLFLDGLGIASPNQLKDAIAFTMLVLVLIFRPTGILGERVTKRA